MRFFVVSDVHGFYDELIIALDKAGFDKNNKEHWLVSCGDEWDRGPNPVKVMNFFNNLERKILIRGNHMDLFEEMCNRGYAERHDVSNGTIQTVLDFAPNATQIENACITAMAITEGYRSQLVNYFETQNYIFVHSWIPTSKTGKPHPADKWIFLTTNEYMEDWRNANNVEWEDAMWDNPFKMWQEGLNKTGKTIVFGHWHCSTGHSMASGGELSEFSEDACWEPFIHDNIIGIDRCTAHTGEVNVLVLEDEFLEG